MLVFFKTGPFAWDGLISWWVPAVDFFGWAVVMMVLTAKAARREGEESPLVTDPLGPITNRSEV
jgi:hypothetical protein